jgi:hypothetical protein
MVRGYPLILLLGIGVCFGTLILGFAAELYSAEYYAKLGTQPDIIMKILWSIGLVIMFCIGLWFIAMGVAAGKVWKEKE